MERPRPRDTAIQYNVPEESRFEAGTKDWLIDRVRDLRNGWVDMPDDRLKKEDYPGPDSDELAELRFKAQSRNKRRVAWLTGVVSYADLAAETFIKDASMRRHVMDRAEALRKSVDPAQPTTDEQIREGDDILDLILAALHQDEEEAA
ncbi:MAG: hypothetical protein HY567_03200 [Candidatus Kerfeldbacteria bacterium]|nr:hypothetical protein [Candidatus Kerfeldbacteria bacterium]